MRDRGVGWLQGRLLEALRLALANPPLKTKNQAVKDRAASCVLSVLSSFKGADMDKAVAELDNASLDLLMKYIYKVVLHIRVIAYMQGSPL